MTKDKMLQEIDKLFHISLGEMRRVIRDFHKEMDAGLSGKEGSLKMIPTYVDSPTGDEKGKYIALDLGGTNFRVLELELKGEGRVSIPKAAKFTIDRKHLTGTGKELFGFIARCVKIFIKAKKLSPDEGLRLGFTFSFPVEQTAVASGTLLRWTKGFRVKGVIGEDVVRLLDEAFTREDIGNIKIAALANDTVGTMVSLGYQDRSCDIGVILGTGTNACYREKLSNIPKWKGPATASGHMIINTEWGNFNKLPVTLYDKQLDKASENPKQQILEKMVSGMYLGELVKLVFKDLMKRNMSAFKTEHMSDIESDTSKNLSKVNRVLKDLGVTGSTLEERQFLKKICEIISLRASRISASAMASIVTKIDPAVSGEHTVAIDGSVYEKHPGFSKNIREALREIFGNKASHIRLALAKYGSGKGAAIIASVV